MAILRTINTCEVPLLLRCLEGEEDPAIALARERYQRWQMELFLADVLSVLGAPGEESAA